MGATPHRCAHAASERSRCGLSPAATSSALATSVPTPSQVNNLGAVGATSGSSATATPKAGTGPVEALRQLRVARSGAMKARTAAANQIHSLCDTAPDAIRAQLTGLSMRKKVALAER